MAETKTDIYRKLIEDDAKHRLGNGTPRLVLLSDPTRWPKSDWRTYDAIRATLDGDFLRRETSPDFLEAIRRPFRPR